MRVLVVFNPVAGGGRAAAEVGAVLHALGQAGHEVGQVSSRPGISIDWLQTPLESADLLVVMGGDGAMRSCSGPAAMRRVPVYQLPFGTENLFARHFGMTRCFEQLVQAIRNWQVIPMDVGMAEEEPFLLMAGGGFDAAVVHATAAARRGSISRWAYASPIVRTAWNWRAPAWRVMVDGRVVVDDQRGTLIVANCPEYAARLNLAGWADPSDGYLDLCFMPCQRAFGVAAWATRAWVRRLAHSTEIIRDRGRSIILECRGLEFWQLDGDPLHRRSAGSISLGIEKTKLLVLRPSALPGPIASCQQSMSN